VAPEFATGRSDNSKSAPASLPEIRDTIDWTKVSLPEGSAPGRKGLSSYALEAPGTFAEAAAFFRKTLPELGWREDPNPVPGIDQKDYLYLIFEKAPMYLTVNGYRANPKGPMTIFLTNWGNVDVRQLPKPADAKFRSNGRFAAMYATGTSPADATDFCRKALVERGWKEVPADSAKFFAKEGRIVLRFLQNAMEVGVVAAKNPAGETEVTLSANVRRTFDASDVREHLAPRDIPPPATITDYLAVIDLREFPLMKDARKRDRQTEPIARSNAITCEVPGTLKEAVLHHRKALLDRGWRETQVDTPFEGRASLHYEKSGYLLTVEAGQHPGEAVQLSVVNHGNVDLRQLPYPPGTEIGPERADFLNCTTPCSDSDAVAFYRKELSRLGWEEIKVRGRGSYSFIKKATLLRLEIGRDIEGRTAVSIRTALISASDSTK
jgi:hypothetical protein